MNLSQPEHSTNNPEKLPPARRRRQRRLLAPLDAGERAAFLDSLAHRLSPTFDFFLFSLLSGIVITFGLITDIPAFLLLGTLLAPLMAPAIGVALGTVTGSAPFFLRSFGGLLVGALLVFSMGLAGGFLMQYLPANGLVQAHIHSQITWQNFILLVFGSVVTALALSNSERHTSDGGRLAGESSFVRLSSLARVASVALAYVLYLPLASAGVGITSGSPYLWPDGLVVFLVHLAWAMLFSAFTLVLLGFKPLTLFGYTFGGAMSLLVIILIIGASGFGAVFGGQVALPTPIPPTLTATLTITPSPTETSTPIPPTNTPVPTLTPSYTPSPTPEFTPTPTPMYAFVNAPEGGGAVLRYSPGFEGRYIRSYLNGTLMIVLPETVKANGEIWAHVRAPDGTEGWMLQDLLAVATPAPNW